MIRFFIALLGVVLAAVQPVAATEPRNFILHGSPKALPEVQFEDEEAHLHSLAEFRGKVVLLNIWATWCHPCRKEIPVLEQLHRDHAARGFEVIGVSVDAAGEEAKVAAFAREMGMTYPLWHDPDERVSSTFLAVGVPATYLIDRKGTLRWRKIGPIAENDSTLRLAIDAAVSDSAQ